MISWGTGNIGSGQDILLQKQVAFKNYIIREFLIPPTSVCIDCDHRGNTEKDFYSLLTNWVDDGSWHLGAGTCNFCKEELMADWEAGKIEDPTITVNGEPIIRADY